MTEKELWDKFAKEKQIESSEYTAWAFGCEPDLLANLVLCGEKTATASLYPIYALEEEPLPYVGEYSVVLDAKGQAVCILRTTKVRILPFDEVSAEHAYKEGEGDKSLEYWRKVHREFFSKEMEKTGFPFTDDMDVVCEEFEVVFRI